MKYVSPLTEDEKTKLNDIVKSDSRSRVRARAHCVLLSAEGYKIDDIADILRADRRSISSWIDAWEGSGFGGLPDRPRSGRPEKLTEEEKKIAAELLRENPRSVKSVICELSEITGKNIGTKTLRRLAKSAGLIWKRVRKSVRPKRDKEEFKKAKKEIGDLTKQQKAGKINMHYFDEAGFDLQPAVPYAWQPKGETLEIPCSRSSRVNVLGFPNVVTDQFHPFIFECPTDSEIAAACFEEFTETVTKKTYVIIDNASTHTSSAFTENIGKWEEKGVFLIYLPTYSPELNLIEILWRFIKYTWLPFSAYASFRHLVRELENILRGVGSEYRINFS